MGIQTVPAAGGGVTPKVVEFTSTGTFTAPANCQYVEVFLVGGGAGGGGAREAGTLCAGGGGGGGQVIVYRKIPVTGGTSYTVTIGAGGAGASTDVGGADGNDSSFGSLLTAFGGGGGGTMPSTGPAFRPRVRATGGGQATRNSALSSAGGGANPVTVQTSGFDPNAIERTISVPLNHDNYAAINGSLTGSLPFGNINSTGSMAGYGIEGFGGGGHGASQFSVSGATPFGAISVAGGGTGGLFSSGSANGGNGTANRGGGGGGGGRPASGSNANGGNGGSGYALVVYWS